MGIVDTTFRTISCNGCDKTVTFDQKDAQKISQENPWLLNTRVLQTGDGRNFSYCSDLCEISGVQAGQHNKPEPKKIIEMPAGAEYAIRQAAAAAKQQEAATAAIKAGQPVTLD